MLGGSLQELVILFGEQGALTVISLCCCWSERLARRRSHQKGCHRGFGSALMLQYRDKIQMHLMEGGAGLANSALCVCIVPSLQLHELMLRPSLCCQLQANVAPAIRCLPCTARASGSCTRPFCGKQPRRAERRPPRLVNGKRRTCLG